MDLGNYADLPKVLNFDPERKNLTLDSLYKVFGKLPNFPTDIKVNRGSTHIHDGVEISELSWSTGYGPLTQSYLLTPAGVDKKLPLVLFLHSHDDLKGCLSTRCPLARLMSWHSDLELRSNSEASTAGYQ